MIFNTYTKITQPFADFAVCCLFTLAGIVLLKLAVYVFFMEIPA